MEFEWYLWGTTECLECEVSNRSIAIYLIIEIILEEFTRPWSPQGGDHCCRLYLQLVWNSLVLKVLLAECQLKKN